MVNDELIKKGILVKITPDLLQQLKISAETFDGIHGCKTCGKNLADADVYPPAKITGFCCMEHFDDWYGIDPWDAENNG